MPQHKLKWLAKNLSIWLDILHNLTFASRNPERNFSGVQVHEVVTVLQSNGSNASSHKVRSFNEKRDAGREMWFLGEMKRFANLGSWKKV